MAAELALKPSPRLSDRLMFWQVFSTSCVVGTHSRTPSPRRMMMLDSDISSTCSQGSRQQTAAASKAIPTSEGHLQVNHWQWTKNLKAAQLGQWTAHAAGLGAGVVKGRQSSYSPWAGQSEEHVQRRQRLTLTLSLVSRIRMSPTSNACVTNRKRTASNRFLMELPKMNAKPAVHNAWLRAAALDCAHEKIAAGAMWMPFFGGF